MQRPRVHTDRDKCLWTALKGVLDLTAGVGRGTEGRTWKMAEKRPRASPTPPGPCRVQRAE